MTGRVLVVACVAIELVTGVARGASITRVSVASDGSQANAGSSGFDWRVSIAVSADGRFVAFFSRATNLVPGGPPEGIFVHDRLTGTTTRVFGGQSLLTNVALSADFRVLAFTPACLLNDPPQCAHVTRPVSVRDLTTAETTVASIALDGSTPRSADYPGLSADGRFVVFHSQASDLVPGDTNDSSDIFVRDLVTGMTERVSVASDGTQFYGSGGPRISLNGRFVAFAGAGETRPIPVPGDAELALHDRLTHTTQLVTVASNGVEFYRGGSSPSISNDGLVAFLSHEGDLCSPCVYVRDPTAGTTEKVNVRSDGSPVGNMCGSPEISADGRFVVFGSNGDTWASRSPRSDVFLRDRLTGVTTRISNTPGGTLPNNWSGIPSISPDGRFVAFVSAASDLVPGDTNGVADVFLWDRDGTPSPSPACTASGLEGVVCRLDVARSTPLCAEPLAGKPQSAILGALDASRTLLEEATGTGVSRKRRNSLLNAAAARLKRALRAARHLNACRTEIRSLLRGLRHDILTLKG